MNVLLAYPEFPETFWSYSHALWFIGKRAVSPPLGLLTVAALLPPHWNKRLVDLNVATLTDRDLAWADYVFISAMGIQRPATEALIRRCKAASKKIVVGGPLFTAEEAFFDEVDHFILNEAELTLPPFLADLEKGTPQRIYQTDQHADLTQSPIPLWHLLDQKRYSTMSVQYSRGCPFACDFCSVTAMLGRTPRGKAVPQVLAELDALLASGWKGPVFFVDDNLIGRRKAVEHELLPALISWRKAHRPLSLFTQVSIDLADDPNLISLMCQAGFDMVFIGIETPDDASLGECGKRQNQNRNVAENIRTLQRAGLEVQAGFIVGFDHDTPSIFQRQIDFIQEAGIVTAMVGLLQALAGTRLYDRLAREHRLRGDSTGDNVDGTTNILPRMGLAPLYQGYAHLLQGLYSPNAYYRRVRTFLREYQLPEFRPPLDLTQLLAFLRSLFHLGIAGRERWEYWRLLAWTTFRRPTMLPIAIRLAIYGHHYMQVCSRYTRRYLLSNATPS
jgi:radical SAM superfamily enzyme YgiQ (UPF0313 family)